MHSNCGRPTRERSSRVVHLRTEGVEDVADRAEPAEFFRSSVIRGEEKEEQGEEGEEFRLGAALSASREEKGHSLILLHASPPRCACRWHRHTMRPSAQQSWTKDDGDEIRNNFCGANWN